MLTFIIYPCIYHGFIFHLSPLHCVKGKTEPIQARQSATIIIPIIKIKITGKRDEMETHWTPPRQAARC